MTTLTIEERTLLSYTESNTNEGILKELQDLAANSDELAVEVINELAVKISFGEVDVIAEKNGEVLIPKDMVIEDGVQ